MKEETKTAREMFEELGYEYKDNTLSWCYERRYLVSHNRVREERISFSKDFKGIIQFYAKDKEKYQEDVYSHTTIETKVIKAIQKQIQELGWEEI